MKQNIFNLKKISLFSFMLLFFIIANQINAAVISNNWMEINCSDASVRTQIGWIPEEECNALADLWNSTNWNNWNNTSGWWNKDLQLSSWYWLSTVGWHITWINLTWNWLKWTIPSTIDKLTYLESLSLRANNITWNIPSSIWNLTNLRSLSLSYTDFWGNIWITWNIPDSLWNLTNLRSLNLSSNKNLTWNIPDSLWNLTNLRSLYIKSDNLTWNIPDSLWNLTNLETLEIYNNNLTWNIPSSFSNLTNLRIFTAHNNKLEWDIPSLVNSNLVSLTFSNNKFVFSDFEDEHNAYYTKMWWAYIYNNQANVDHNRTITFEEWQDLVITPELAENPTGHDIYKWYKWGALLSGTDRIYTKTAELSDAWEYKYIVTNSVIPWLEIKSNTITINITRDLTPPSTPTIAPDLIDSADTWDSNTDDITWDNTPTFNLTCSEVGSTLKLYRDWNPTNYSVNCTESWAISEISIINNLPDGDYYLSYSEVDQRGNESWLSPSLKITIDTSAPSSRPVVITNKYKTNKPVITWTASIISWENLTIEINWKTYSTNDTELALNWSNWTLNISSPIPDWVYNVIATIKDSTWHSISDSTTNEVTIDTVAPNAPVITSPTNWSPVKWTWEPWDTIKITTPSWSSCSTIVLTNWTFSCTLYPTPENWEQVAWIQTDPIWNVSPVWSWIISRPTTNNNNTSVHDYAVTPYPVLDTPTEWQEFLETVEFITITWTTEKNTRINLLLTDSDWNIKHLSWNTNSSGGFSLLSNIWDFVLWNVRIELKAIDWYNNVATIYRNFKIIPVKNNNNNTVKESTEDTNQDDKPIEKETTVNWTTVKYWLKDDYKSCEVIDNLLDKNYTNWFKTYLKDIENNPYARLVKRLEKAVIVHWDINQNWQWDRWITRAELLAIILKAHCYNYEPLNNTILPFVDVNSNNWQYRVIKKAYDMWIVDWDVDNSWNRVFRENDFVTRAEAMAMIMNMSLVHEKWLDSAWFTDLEASWQEEYLAQAIKLWIIAKPSKSDTKFYPQNAMKRNDFVYYLFKTLNLYRK